MSLPRVLLVDDNENLRNTLQIVLKLNDFDVVTAWGIDDALRHINAEKFEVLLSDQEMMDHGDGLTLLRAMRHANPQAVTLMFTAAGAILLHADEILVKPLSMADLIRVIRQKLESRAQPVLRATKSVANILESDGEQIIQEWLARVENNKDLMQVPLSSQERTGHLPQLLKDLVMRLRQRQKVDGKHLDSIAAQAHGKLRRLQGYSASLIVEESRILQVSIFHTLQKNLIRVDFGLVLFDVMTIADEVDAQLGQALQTFAKLELEYSA
jgi:DNA-binding response OmpR family regulator